MGQEYIYDAFISYRHTKLDKAVADRLQRLLEKYIPPKSIKSKKDFKKMRLFRDETELPTSGNLGGDIKAALETSRFLIVICGETYTESKWCMEELRYFKELQGGSTQNILALLIEGDPHKVFPKELCYETRVLEDGSTETVEIEPLAANVTAPDIKASLKKLNREFLRIAAPLLGCGFDELYNRNQRRFMRKVYAISATVITFLIAFSVYTSLMLVEINKQKTQAEINEQEAKRQEAEARRQEQEAKRQEQLAVDNFNDAKALMLSNAISYAGALNEQGARGRAGIILQKAYENIDNNRGDAGKLFAEFRDTVINTLYYNDETKPFAKTDLLDEILEINFISGQDSAIVMTAANLYIVDTVKGDILKTYEAPDGEAFCAAGVYGVYALAVTSKGRVLIIDTLSDTEVISQDGVADYYVGNIISAIAYNENASAIITVTYAGARFADTPGDVTYIEAKENERYGKVLLTVIPCDLSAPSIQTDAAQTIVYKSDWEMGQYTQSQKLFSMPDNGRFAALAYNYEIFSVDDGISGERVNNDITLIYLDEFDQTKSPAENRETMTKTVDCRLNGEEDFDIENYSISALGVLTVDGKTGTVIYNCADEFDINYLSAVRDGAVLPDYGKTEAVMDDSAGNAVIFNKVISSEDSGYGSGFIPIENGYYFKYEEEQFYENEGETSVIQITGALTNEYSLAYLDAREDSSFLKIFNVRSGEMAAEYKLPDGFSIISCYAYKTELENYYDIIGEGPPSFVLIGKIDGESKNLLLEKPFLGEEQIREFQTTDIISTAAAVDLESERMLIGHKDGKLLMFNYGISAAHSSEAAADTGDVRSVKYGAVYIGSEETDIALPAINDAFSIEVVAYNSNRSEMFGYEPSSEYGRVYSVWDIENGEIIKSFYEKDFSEKELYWAFDSDFSMQINIDFTYAVAADTSDSENYVYYVVDVGSGEILYTYNIPVVSTLEWNLDNKRNKIFYGIGGKPNVILFFFEDVLQLREVDVSTGKTISSKYIAERFDMGEAFFNIDGGIIIFYDFTGAFSWGTGNVYSLSSDKVIYSKTIYGIEPDGSAIIDQYYDEYAEKSGRVELTPEALYETLKQFPYVGTMTDADIEATGFDVWGK